MLVIPHTAEVNVVEALLDNALFTVVGGSRSAATPT
jgi:hypothetical protein